MPSWLSNVAISTAENCFSVDPLTVESYARNLPSLLHVTDRTGRSGSVMVRTTDMECRSQTDTEASLHPTASKGRPWCVALVMLMQGAQWALNSAISCRSSCR